MMDLMVRRTIAIGLALSVLGLASAGADDGAVIGPPFELGGTLEPTCGPATFATCAAEGTFDPEEGTVQMSLRVTAGSPGAGTGLAYGGVVFVARDQVLTPVPSLDYVVDLHVGSAAATTTGLMANDLDLFDDGGYAFFEVQAIARHAACSCEGLSDVISVVSAPSGAPSSVTDEVIPVAVTLLPEEGSNTVPVGEVTVDIFFHARAALGFRQPPAGRLPDTGESAVTVEASAIARRVA